MLSRIAYRRMPVLDACSFLKTRPDKCGNSAKRRAGRLEVNAHILARLSNAGDINCHTLSRRDCNRH